MTASQPVEEPDTPGLFPAPSPAPPGITPADLDTPDPQWRAAAKSRSSR